MSFSTKISLHGGVCVLRLSGDMDGASQESLDAAIARCSAWRNCLIVDLKGVEYVGSTALGSLLALNYRLSRKAGALAIARAGKQVERIFEVAGVIGALSFFDSLDGAAEYVNSVCAESKP